MTYKAQVLRPIYIPFRQDKKCSLCDQWLHYNKFIFLGNTGVAKDPDGLTIIGRCTDISDLCICCESLLTNPHYVTPEEGKYILDLFPHNSVNQDKHFKWDRASALITNYVRGRVAILLARK